MNKLLVLLSSVLLSTSTLAMSGHVGISTDYMWRGQTQTDHGLAVNFGIEQDLGQGFDHWTNGRRDTRTRLTKYAI